MIDKLTTRTWKPSANGPAWISICKPSAGLTVLNLRRPANRNLVAACLGDAGLHLDLKIQ